MTAITTRSALKKIRFKHATTNSIAGTHEQQLFALPPGSARVWRIGHGVLAVANFVEGATDIPFATVRQIVATGHRQPARKMRALPNFLAESHRAKRKQGGAHPGEYEK